MKDYRHISERDSGWARMYKEDGVYLNSADWMYMNQTALGQTINVESTTQFAFKSVFPLSDRRDRQITANGGSISHVNGAEYRIRASSTAGSVAQLETKQLGDYVPEHVFLPSMGVRVPTQPTGNAKIQYGYCNHDGTNITNGTFLEYNTNGLFHRVISGSSEKHKEQIDVDVSTGEIYRFPFLFYGYGFAGIDVPTMTNGSYQVDRKSTYYPDGELLMQNSNLPLICRVEGDGTQLDAFVAGRQMSVIGENKRIFRASNEIRKQASIANATDYVPMVSVQLKTGYKEIFTQLREVAVIADADMDLAIILNGTLTGDNFTAPADYDGTEVATDWDNEATAISGGSKIYGAVINGGNKSTLTQSGLPEFPLTSGDTISFCLRLISGTNGTATLTAEAKENW